MFLDSLGSLHCTDWKDDRSNLERVVCISALLVMCGHHVPVTWNKIMLAFWGDLTQS